MMKIDAYLSTLERSRLFSGLSSDDLLSVFDSITYKISQYSKNEIIHNEDDICTTISIILDGNIEIQKIDAFGKILSVALFKPGETFGENLIFGDKNKYPMTVLSKTDSTILHIQKDSVVKLCQINSQFMNEFLRAISNRAMILSLKLKEVTLKTIRQKICEFLLMKYERSGKTEISIGMTKKEWADKLGIQRPSLSRELIKMKEEGIIDYDKDIIYIKDAAALENN